MSRMTESIGRVLGGRYRIIAPIGRGASAQVFLADDVRLRRRVAVKMLHAALADDAEFLRRFQAEAQAAASLSHPNVLAVFDWGDDDEGVPYLVLEYLGGGSLRALLDRGNRLTPSQALLVGLEAARGLDYAHRRGFVHRDIKPANLLFGDDGRLRIADFGLARALAEAAWTEPHGAVLGTARYASPEQAQGLPLTGRADVYSLGLVLVEAVTGEVPFATDTTIGTLMARVDQPVPVPDALGPLAEPLRRVGRPQPDERPDARQLGDALLSVAESLPRPAPLPLAGALDHDPGTAPADPTMHAGSRPSDPDADTVHGPAPAVLDLRDAAAAEIAGAAAGEAPAQPVVDWADDDDLAGDDLDDDGTGPPVRTRRRRRWPAVLLALLVVSALAVAGLLLKDVVVPTPSHVVPASLVNSSLDDARQVVDANHWHLAPLRRVYRERTLPDQVLAVTPRPGTDLKEGETVTLLVSKGPPPVAVPGGLAGLSVEEASNRLVFVGLVPVEDHQYSEDVDKGLVIKVADGTPGTVPKGGTVTLVVSDGPAPRAVPDGLVGAKQADAEAKVTSVGLTPTVTKEYSDTVAEGLVMAVDPPAGQLLDRGAEVRLTVSRGPQPVPVPSVVGMTKDGAVAALKAEGFVPGIFKGSAAGQPVGTDPAAGTLAQPGTTVDIILG